MIYRNLKICIIIVYMAAFAFARSDSTIAKQKNHFIIGCMGNWGTHRSADFDCYSQLSLQPDLRCFAWNGLYLKPYLRYDVINFYQCMCDHKISDFSFGAGAGYALALAKERFFPYVELNLAYNKQYDKINNKYYRRSEFEFPMGIGMFFLITKHLGFNASIIYLKHKNSIYDNIQTCFGFLSYI